MSQTTISHYTCPWTSRDGSTTLDLDAVQGHRIIGETLFLLIGGSWVVQLADPVDVKAVLAALTPR